MATRSIAVFKRARRNADDILLARFVATQMANSPLFDSPPIPYAKVAADLDALEAAEAHTRTRALDSVSSRDALFLVVLSELHALRGYVQSLADHDPAHAGSIIESAGMSVKKSSGHGRASFKVRAGPTGDAVTVFGRRAKVRAYYEWQLSLDGESWQTGAWTTKASAVLRGLAAGRRYFFRFRVGTNECFGDWSPVLDLVLP